MNTKLEYALDEAHGAALVVAHLLYQMSRQHGMVAFNLRVLHLALPDFLEVVERHEYTIDFDWDPDTSRYRRLDATIERLMGKKILLERDPKADVQEFDVQNDRKLLQEEFNQRSASLITAEELRMLREAGTALMRSYREKLPQYAFRPQERPTPI